jgi:hypothetical protein
LAANPQRAEAPGRRKKPRRRRVEATPPDHPWSWPTLYLRSRKVAGSRANEKRKKSSPPGTNMLPCCHTPMLLHANISRLQSSSFSTPARVPRNGNRSNGLCGGYHCRGGHRARGWCDPAAANKYPAMGYVGEEDGHEEVDTGSLHPVA